MLLSNFPGGSDGKVSVYNAGDQGSIPGLGRSPGEGNNPKFELEIWKVWRYQYKQSISLKILLSKRPRISCQLVSCELPHYPNCRL